MNIYTFLPEYADVLLPKDLQIILHVGRNTFYKLLDDGSIKSIKVENCYRMPDKRLFDIIAQNILRIKPFWLAFIALIKVWR